MSSSAPKFASFRPKPKVPEQPPPEEPRRQEKDHRTRRPSRERRRGEINSPPRREQRPQDEPSNKSYFSDRRGDLDIVKYGTPNRYHLPSYRRAGYGSVLGLPEQKIDRDYSTDKTMYMTPLVRPRQKRMLTDKHAARDSKRTLRLVKTAESQQTDAARDFVALSSIEPKKRGSGHDSEGVLDDTLHVDYRGIDEQRDPDKVDDPDTYYESGTEASISNSEVTQKNSRLVRETRDDPSSLQAWLDLIEHQESMMKLDRATIELSAADRQNLADVRISTYEEALRKIGNKGPGQIELLAGLLREAQRHWDDAKVVIRWQEVLKKHPHSMKLWLGYLDFVQSTFSRFKYDDCRVAFLQALQALRSADVPDHPDTPDPRLHLFVRLTALAQEAGYQELALAAWQAVLEYNLLAPQEDHDERVKAAFEEFWESEAPRIGEPDSKGWRYTSIDDVLPPPCSITLDTSGGPVCSIDDFRKGETEYTSKLRYPGRSTDDVGEEDPFHTIFFSDLRDVIANVPSVSAAVHIDAFFCFCGLPPLAGNHAKGPWWDDPYTCKFERSPTPEVENPQYFEAHSQKFESVRNDNQNPAVKADFSCCMSASLQMTSDLLIQQTFSLESSRLSPGFVRNVLKILTANVSNSESVGEYLLAFESKHFPSEVAKTAKRLLKANPTSVRLYNMYGLVENYADNSAKAVQVFAAALNIRSSPADRLQLLSSFVWQALHMGDKAEALRRLVCSDSNSPPTEKSQFEQASVEPARSALQSSLETALLSHDLSSAVYATSLLSLLTYLTTSFDASSALLFHSNLTSWYHSHRLSSSTHAERHAQAIARLLEYHVATVPVVKPSLVREALEPLLATFPSNTILLSTYAANEARFAIDDRVRGNMSRVLNLTHTSSVATWAFAIHRETSKSAIAGSTSHSVRALYKRATSIDAEGAHCPALWAMYMKFEIADWQRAKERSAKLDKRPRRDGKKSKWQAGIDDAAERVKETFYTGLRLLPWCKEFVLLAFTDAGSVFGDDELARLYGVMVEKELRLYTELDELGP